MSVARIKRILNARKRELLIVLALVLPLIILVVVPLALLVFNSFRAVGIGEIGFSLNKFTLQNYVTAYLDRSTWLMLKDSFVYALGSMLVASLMGGIMAFLVERTDIPFRNLTYGMMFMPLIIPGMLQAVAWILLASPNIGLINKLWMSTGAQGPLLSAYSMPMMWFVQGVIETPLTFLLIGTALRRMDPALEEAAITCGASKIRIATRVTSRLILPAIAGVALLQFVQALEALEVPLLIGLNSGVRVFSTNILMSVQSFPPDYGLGFAYAVTLIALTVAGLVVYQKMLKNSERFAVVSGKGYRPRVIGLGNFKVFAVAFQVFFAVVAILLPLLVLIWASLLPNYQVPSQEALGLVSLNNYLTVFDRSDVILMFRNTVVLATCAGILVMLFSLLLSWVIHHMKIKGGGIIDTLSFLPYAIPAIALGIAFMILFLSFKNPIYGTIWILVIAYTIRFLPYGTRFTHAGLVQIHKELEEAAQLSGASFGTTFRQVIVPLMKPALVGGGLYVFILSVKVFTVAAILSSPKSVVLSTQIYQLWTEGRIGVLGALAVIMVAGLGVLTMLGGKGRMGRMLG